MQIHFSGYEKQGWIPVGKEKPVPETKIQLAHIRMIDWYLENMDWQSTGWMLKSGSFSIKHVEGLTRNNGTVTHWKAL